jgi:hypothetical protein
MIRAIETTYANTLFRSRLEARWAVFFDELGVRWQYELDGFELPSGKRYLPDFFLPDIGCWFEVKPAHVFDERWSEFADYNDHPLYVAAGMPSACHVFWPLCGDVDHRFCICEACGKVGIQFEGQWWRICGHQDSRRNDSPPSTSGEIDSASAVAKAFDKALGVRFWAPTMRAGSF